MVSNNLYNRSMLRIFPLLSFMVTYGLMQMVLVRWLLPSYQETHEMGFGQITPLFLLVLPMFLAADMLW